MQGQNNLTATNILRQSVKFNAVNILSAAVSFFTGIVIARVLIPDEYGVIGLVGLWSVYAGLINPGIDSAAAREMTYLLGKGEKEKALRLQNIAITGKLLFSFLPFIIMLVASFFLYSDRLIRIGLILTSINYIVSTNTNYWPQFNQVRQQFNKVAAGNLITSCYVIARLLAENLCGFDCPDCRRNF